MTTRTVTAMFKSRDEAARAAERLVSELHVDRTVVRTSPETGATDTGYDKSRPYEETGFLASMKNLFLPEEDRHAYAEGMRRGNVLVSAQVEENQIERASDILEEAGALDLDAQETTWRQSGWKGYDSTAASQSRGTLAAGTSSSTATSLTGAAGTTATQATASTATSRMGQTGRDEVIPIVEERLVIGKREVERGRVRVRSYVVERPVEEQVTLHEERVGLERHAVDRPLTGADEDAFRERTIEATATAEEAVVSKEARVVEEVSVHKDVADRTETVHDTVRRTEVEVDNNLTGTTGTTGATGSNPPGTAASRATDRTLGTNVSGTNPGANAPDGTPGNPPGTMASRAVDKTLGTNISGANPGRKS